MSVILGGGLGPVVTLVGLGLGNPVAVAGQAWTSTILGAAAGSTITATSSDGTALTVAGGSVSGTFAAGGAPTITFTETLANVANNSPNVSTSKVGVAITLQGLTLSASTFAPNAAAGTVIGTISGKTAGSVLSLSPNDGRVAFNSDQSALVVGLTASAAGTLNYTLAETLATATNSPNKTAESITVANTVPMLVSSNGWIGHVLNATGTTLTDWQMRVPHPLGGDCSSVTPAFANWYMNGLVETAGTSALTISKAYLEYNGMTVQITKGGLPTWTVDATKVFDPCDPILPAAFGLTKYSADTIPWIRAESHNVLVNTDTIIGGTAAKWTGAFMAKFDPANYINQTGNTGNMSSPTGSIGLSTAPPSYLIGNFINPASTSWAIVGASETYGYSDPYSGGSGAPSSGAAASIAGPGYMARARDDGTLHGIIAGINLATAGEYATQFNSGAVLRKQWMAYCNRGYEDYGSNGIAAAQSFATITASIQATWAMMYGQGVQKILRGPIQPRATSTDSFVTLANQTPLVGWGPGDLMDQINAWSLTQIGVAGGVTAYVDILTPSSDPSNIHAWKTNGTVHFYTHDGVHGSENLYPLLGLPVMRPAMLAIG